jgi:hypothetical protein
MALARASVAVGRVASVGAAGARAPGVRTIFGDSFGQKGLGPIGESFTNRASKVNAHRARLGPGGQGADHPTYLHATYDRPVLLTFTGVFVLVALPTIGLGLRDVLTGKNRKE